jgi:Fe-S oxidoreductase
MLRNRPTLINEGMSMNEIDKIIDNCIECGICVEDCEFLIKFCESPKELAEKFRSLYFREKPMIPYSCNLCDLCETLCPNELNIGRMCMELRLQMVEEGFGPLRSHKLVEIDQEWVLSDSFTLALSDPAVMECPQVFFPGCNLAGYSPSLVLKTYDYLVDRQPGTGILLGCCGSPTRELGDKSRFTEIMKGIESKMEWLGSLEILVSCPYCYYSFKSYGPNFNIRSLYEVILEEGLPENVNGDQQIFSLHDSCKARWETNMQNSVRTLVSLLGHRIHEMAYSREKARCCGMGGMVPFVNMNLANTITNRRIEEAKYDILTYCASCREAFSRKKPSLHILDLIFNLNWRDIKNKPPNKLSIRRENQSQLKKALLEKGAN